MSTLTAQRKTDRRPDPTPAEIELRAAEIRARWKSNDPRNNENNAEYSLPVISSRHLTSARPFVNRNS